MFKHWHIHNEDIVEASHCFNETCSILYGCLSRIFLCSSDMESIIVLANREMAAVLFSAYYAKTIIDMKTTISFSQSSKTRLANILSPWLASKNHLFSSIMSDKDEKVIVTNRQALLILQALVSGSLLFCSTFVHWFVAVVLLCWFTLSVIQCKKGGLRWNTL